MSHSPRCDSDGFVSLSHSPSPSLTISLGRFLLLASQSSFMKILADCLRWRQRTPKAMLFYHLSSTQATKAFFKQNIKKRYTTRYTQIYIYIYKDIEIQRHVCLLLVFGACKTNAMKRIAWESSQHRLGSVCLFVWVCASM